MQYARSIPLNVITALLDSADVLRHSLGQMRQIRVLQHHGTVDQPLRRIRSAHGRPLVELFQRFLQTPDYHLLQAVNINLLLNLQSRQSRVEYSSPHCAVVVELRAGCADAVVVCVSGQQQMLFPLADSVFHTLRIRFSGV